MKNEILTQMFGKFEREIRDLAKMNNEIALTILKQWNKLEADSEKLRYIQSVEHLSLMMSSGRSHDDHLPMEHKS